MADSQLETVRSRIVASVVALDGWVESRRHFALMVSDADDLQPRNVAVGFPRTDVTDQNTRRVTQRASSLGALSETAILVRWVHRLQADGVPASYGEILEEERDVLQAISTTDLVGLGTLVPRSIERTVREDGLFHVTTVVYVLNHTYRFAVGS